MASASTFTLDFLCGWTKKKMSGATQIFVIRILIAAFIAVSSVIAAIQYKGGVSFIAQLMGVSWGALAGAFLAPFLYGLYWRGAAAGAVWCNFIFASAFMIANIFLRPYFPKILASPINAGAFTMIAGLVIVARQRVHEETGGFPGRKLLRVLRDCRIGQSRRIARFR
jgi:SSS family solute:Na+ symporter